MSEIADCPMEPALTPAEVRVLGCLMEKQRATPNNYPLTLNALVLACNQKTSRVPVMNLNDGDVGHTLNRLRDRQLVRVGGLGRAERYHHRLGEQLDLDQARQAVLLSRPSRSCGIGLPEATFSFMVNCARRAGMKQL